MCLEKVFITINFGCVTKCELEVYKSVDFKWVCILCVFVAVDFVNV